MKQFRVITIIFFMCYFSAQNLFSQQTVIASWNFENENKRANITNAATFLSNPYTADAGNVLNADISAISLHEGPNFTAWVAGSGGTGTFAVNSRDWNNGGQSAYWQIVINTTGYENLTLSSKQQSSASGPKDYIVQYSLNGINWTEIIDSEVNVANNFTTGFLNNLQLPAVCNNRATLYIRWLLVSNIAVNNGDILAVGTNRIDDIIIKGTPIQINHPAINPLTFHFDINNPADFYATITWNNALSVLHIANVATPDLYLMLGVDYFIEDAELLVFASYIMNELTDINQTLELLVKFNTGYEIILTISTFETSEIGADINPKSFQFDLTNPSNITAIITWNDANTVISIQDNQFIPYFLQASDYLIENNTLTILSSYLSSVFTIPGMTLQYTVNFDLGESIELQITSHIAAPIEETIALWNFENANKRANITNNESFISNPYTADSGNVHNMNISPIKLGGGSTFTAWVGGTGGTGTFAANSRDWHDGANSKYWYITVNTLAYGQLKLSSIHRSSATGPKFFKAQYSIDGSTWHNIPDTEIICAENFTSGVLNNIALPVSCNNQQSLYIRWIATSTEAINGGTVAAAGTNRIDDIVIKGTLIMDEADILSYMIMEQIGETIIDPENKEIQIEVPYGTDVTNLIAVFALSPNANARVNGVLQQSGITSNDFSGTVIYTISSGNGTVSSDWHVIVTIADPSSEADFLSYTFLGQNVISSNIDANAGVINISIYETTGMTYDFIAEFSLSHGATAYIDDVLQESGVTENEFSEAVVYRIVAQDGETQKNWTVNTNVVVNYLETKSVIELSLYPNPNQGSFTIEVSENGLLEIIDIHGRVVYTKNCQTGLNFVETTISNGMYFMRYKTENSIDVIRLQIAE